MNLLKKSFPNYILSFLLITPLFIGSCAPSLTHQLVNQEQLLIDSKNTLDSNMYYTILPYRDSLSKIMDQPIGENSKLLQRFKPESPLSNFVADLLLEAGTKFIHERSDQQLSSVAVVNTKGLRAPLPQGVVTVENIYEIMPFENSMVAVQLNGAQMQKLFDHIVSEGGDGLAGASFTMSPPAQAKDVLVQNKKLQNEELYWVFTSDYLADGGDNYMIFRESETIVISPYTIRNLIMNKVKELHKNNMPVEASTEVRIKNEDF